MKILILEKIVDFVVVGGGFSGVEIVGELNDFGIDSIKHFYHNLQKTYTRIVLVNSGRRILPEVTEELAEFALEKIRNNGVEVMLNTRVNDITPSGVKLDNGTDISTETLSGLAEESLKASYQPYRVSMINLGE